MEVKVLQVSRSVLIK